MMEWFLGFPHPEDPYEWIINGLIVLCLLVMIWALTPWFPWPEGV
jgi:hypothetical protein